MGSVFCSDSGTPTYNKNTTFVEYNDSLLIKIFYAYHFVGLIWISQFILACQELVIGSVVAQHYFAESVDFSRLERARNAYAVRTHNHT